MAMAALSSRNWLWQAPANAATTTTPQAPCFVLSCLRHNQGIGASNTVAKPWRILWNDGAGEEIDCARRSSRVVVCASLGAGGGGGSEEERWLREEARWEREEQRWLREEARWNQERLAWARESEDTVEEVRELKREIEQLRADAEDRRRSSAALSTVIASLKHLLQSLPPSEAKPELFVEEPISVSRSSGQVFESSDSDDAFSEVASFSGTASIPCMSEFSIDLVSESPDRRQEATLPLVVKRDLKKGAEGEEVKAVQEALAALGFYSGEEDMENSAFDSDTESAVKTWQASVGVKEDGVLSVDLLDVLFGRKSPPTVAGKGKNVSQAKTTVDSWKSPVAVNGKGVQAQKKSFAEDKRDVEGTLQEDIAPNRRVFLLGENRWEEPGRLNKPINGKSTGPKPVVKEKCFSCRGEGITMCTECEGTGDLNVEDQFLEWVEEGAKCPYCEGSGAVPCDLCSGIGAVPKI